MIIDREEFIKICWLLAHSDIQLEDCNYITKFIVELGKENQQLKKSVIHEHKYGSEMEGKYILEREKNRKAIEYIENADWYLPLWEIRDKQPDKNSLLEILKDNE